MQKLKEELLKEISAGLNVLGKDIKDTIGQQQPVTIIQQGNSQPQGTYAEAAEISDSVLTDIHARAMGKITKDTKGGNVSYIEQKVQDNQVDKNVSELEDMLG